MKSYLVTYDLIKEGQNYEKIEKAIKAYPNWAKIQLSVWVIKSDESPDDIARNLYQAVDSNDKIAIFGLDGSARWRGLPENVSAWIKNYL